MNLLAPLPVVLPWLAALLIGIGILRGRLQGEAGEAHTARLAVCGALGGALAALLLAALRAGGLGTSPIRLGTWLRSGDYAIPIDFLADPLSLGLSGLFALLALAVTRFAVTYLHREPAFHRFFLILCLFNGAMQLLVTAGNAVLGFVGWELSGVASYLLIAYAWQRDQAADNANRAILTNRVGDAGFLLSIALAFLWLGDAGWVRIGAAAGLSGWQMAALAGGFMLAAAAKSAQLPFSPWLTRAMEGPTPSSAIFYGALLVHAGVYLVLRLEPLFGQSPGARLVLGLIGGSTALYGWLASQVQTDAKSSLIFATIAQTGLMFLACGLGWWELAAWHLAAHAVVRCQQLLTAPELIHHLKTLPPGRPPGWMRGDPRLYLAALQRFRLEAAIERQVVYPLRNLARGFADHDARLTRALGLPAGAVQGLSELAQWGENQLGAGAALERPLSVRRPLGLVGWLTEMGADAVHWVEERLILGGGGGRLADAARLLGRLLQRLEHLLEQPRRLLRPALLILAAWLALIGGWSGLGMGTPPPPAAPFPVEPGLLYAFTALLLWLLIQIWLERPTGGAVRLWLSAQALAIVGMALNTAPLPFFLCALAETLAALGLLRAAGLGLTGAGRQYLLYATGGLALMGAGLALGHGSPGAARAQLALLLLVAGFGSRLGMFPLHGWLPSLARSAPALPALALLAGAKIGVLGLARFAVPLLPALPADWSLGLAWLALAGVIYGAILALLQIGLRRLLAFALVSQNSMLLLGLATGERSGIAGSLLLSVTYGLAFAFMALITGLVARRAGTTLLGRLGGLYDTQPLAALGFLIAALSTMTMPGTPGFDPAHWFLEAVIERFGWTTALVAAAGNVLTAAFLLWAFQRVFLADPRRATPGRPVAGLGLARRIAALVMCGLLLAGFYSRPLMGWLELPLEHWLHPAPDHANAH